jgi:hypothetical protein
LDGAAAASSSTRVPVLWPATIFGSAELAAVQQITLGFFCCTATPCLHVGYLAYSHLLIKANAAWDGSSKCKVLQVRSDGVLLTCGCGDCMAASCACCGPCVRVRQLVCGTEHPCSQTSKGQHHTAQSGGVCSGVRLGLQLVIAPVCDQPCVWGMLGAVEVGGQLRCQLLCWITTQLDRGHPARAVPAHS